MAQDILIVLLFIIALGYLGWLIYKHFRASSGCASGCGKCNAVDFEKIEKQVKLKPPF